MVTEVKKANTRPISKIETIAVIPAFNEESNVKAVVQKAKGFVQQVIVVDDGSEDCTGAAAKDAGAKVVRTQNRGAGAATYTGILGANYVFGASTIVTLDSDGQHNANDIPKLLRPIKEGQADVVIGSRFIQKYTGPVYRKLGISIINWIFNVGHKVKISDTQCCLRAYNMKRCMALLPISEKQFGYSIEIIAKARKMGLRIVEVPVECIYRNEKDDSTWNPVRHGFSVAMKTIYWRLKLWN